MTGVQTCALPIWHYIEALSGAASYWARGLKPPPPKFAQAPPQKKKIIGSHKHFHASILPIAMQFTMSSFCSKRTTMNQSHYQSTIITIYSKLVCQSVSAAVSNQHDATVLHHDVNTLNWTK